MPHPRRAVAPRKSMISLGLALAASLILASPALAACPEATEPSCSITVLGKQGKGVMRQAQATAIAPDGSLYVADR